MKRIKLIHGTARVSDDISQETVNALNKLVVAAYHQMNEDFILNMLADIENGKLTVVPLEKPEDVYCGDISYRVSNGYTIVVFDDCDEFDYISSIVSPDGVEFDPWEYKAEYERLRSYRPDDRTSKEVYFL